MSHLKDEIEDEKKGHEHYEGLAKKDPKHKKAFYKMARDEEAHSKKLKHIESKEAKTKALHKKMK